jgi:thioesterase domain-containing protein
MAAPREFSPFVPIKSGSEKPPIFILHGFSGTVECHELAREIRSGHPVYGVQAKGIDGLEKPFDRVEDLASFYLDELEKSHLEGPYILIGYSFGGLVALEMARRLTENKQGVAMLVLLHAFPHPRFLSADQRARLIAKRMGRHFHEVRRIPLQAVPSYLVSQLRHRWRSASIVHEANYRAYTNYRPRSYPGKMRFVATSIETSFPDDPVAVWRGLVHELEVEVVRGDHLSIVTTEFKFLASVLTRYVEQVTSQSV